MHFKYVWNKKEANFGKPLKYEAKGGTHITFEIVMKWSGNYIALRRQSIPGHEIPPLAKKCSKGLLYFCHDLIRRGESTEQCIKRIVKSQAGVGVVSYRIVDLESIIQKKDSQWAIIPTAIAELASKPKTGIYGNEVSEVVEFGKESVPTDFAWWPKGSVAEFLKKFD